MNSKYKKLESHLKSLGISAECMSRGTANGTPAIFIHKNGSKYTFTEYSEGDVMSGFAALKDDYLKEEYA